MSAFYAQMIGEELCVRPEVISLILATPTTRQTVVIPLVSGIERSTFAKSPPTRTRRC
jgi:hypothetical protein